MPKTYAVKSGSLEARSNTREAIQNLEPFTTSGALSGVVGRTDADRLRSLDLMWHNFDADHIDYTVLSYGTPIAWHVSPDWGGLGLRGGWHIVLQKFSPTTSTHQSVVRRALGLNHA
jgi:hypothetical protein